MSVEEEKLEKWKEEIMEQRIPEDRLQAAIRMGFERAKRKKRKKRLTGKKGFWSAIVAAVMVVAFVTSIRVSPAFANAVASLPGMDKIVALIADNEGLQSAIRHEHYQVVGVTDEAAGVRATVEGIIADQTNLVVFYTLELEGARGFIEKFELTGANGEDLDWGSMSHNYDDQYDKSVSMNALEISFQGPLPTKDVVLEIKVMDGYGEELSLKLPFTIESDVEDRKYAVNETVMVAGQSITIRNVVISPVRTAIEVELDPANTMEIFGFEDLRIVDEKGRVWSSIQNGVTASGTQEEPNRHTFYLQSNYFEEADHLYLQFGRLMAMEKEETTVVIDTERQQLLRQPKDARFSNLRIENGTMQFDFRGEKGFIHTPLSIDFIDADGKEYTLEWWTGVGEAGIPLRMGLPNKPFANPLTFTIQGYPSYISGDVNLKLR
ncbi:DUF4179 domain-containing protein [Sporosarcina sp. 179-K 3D1 HS]|uniref:DUF4179 domain-containing protein n=1 Tax=Sporosarcina sp. 179-K 3D1 HS TaxID=3232169 RepID=UPI0039A1197D